MHAELDYDVGPKLQRAMRQSTSEQSVTRSQIILRSGLGETADHLANEFDMEPNKIRALIVDFNVRRMKAISRKRPTRLNDTMNAADEEIIEALIDLTPRPFDLPDLRWLPEEIIDFVKEHGLVQGIDTNWIKETLESNRPRRPFK